MSTTVPSTKSIGEDEQNRDSEAIAPDSERRTPKTARPLSPRAIILFGLALAVLFLTAVIFDRKLTNDVFWQMTAGQWMLAHHRVIGLDPFSYTESHRRWINDEWGSEVILATLHNLFGVWAYNLIAIITGTLCLICTTLYARALGASRGRLVAIALLMSISVVGYVMQDRGLSFSLIWLPLELLILTKARSNPRWLWWIPPLFLCWVNTHGSILVGLMVLGLEFAWSVTPQQWATRIHGVGRSTHSRQLFGIGVLGLLATFITPYGPYLDYYDIHVATNTQIGQYITEWNSPDFHAVMTIVVFVLPIAIFALALRQSRLMVLEATLTALFFIGALHSVRIAIYLFVATAGLAASLPMRKEWGPRARRIAGAIGIVVAITMLAAPSVPVGTVTSDTPVTAFNFLSDHPGRVFTQYVWGDYSIIRHRATFADGRTDLFTGPVLTEFFDVTRVTVNPDPILSRYHVDYVVWPYKSPLEEYLSHDSEWVVVDRTGPAVVFARKSIWNSEASHA